MGKKFSVYFHNCFGFQTSFRAQLMNFLISGYSFSEALAARAGKPCTAAMSICLSTKELLGLRSGLRCRWKGIEETSSNAHGIIQIGYSLLKPGGSTCIQSPDEARPFLFDGVSHCAFRGFQVIATVKLDSMKYEKI